MTCSCSDMELLEGLEDMLQYTISYLHRDPCTRYDLFVAPSTKWKKQP